MALGAARVAFAWEGTCTKGMDHRATCRRNGRDDRVQTPVAGQQATATRRDSSFRRRPHAEIGNAWSHSPLWAAAAWKPSLARWYWVFWLLCNDWNVWETTVESSDLWLKTITMVAESSAERPDSESQRLNEILLSSLNVRIFRRIWSWSGSVPAAEA